MRVSLLDTLAIALPFVMALAALITAWASLSSARNTRKILDAQEAERKRKEEDARVEAKALETMLRVGVLHGQRNS